MRFFWIRVPRLGAAALFLLFDPAGVHAAESEGGRPRIGIEFEQKKAADHSGRSDSITLSPGIKWDQGWLTMLELLLEAERERETGAGARQTGGSAGVRVRKDIVLAPQLKGSLRGLLGRSFGGEDGFTYAYVEPALKYAFAAFEFSVGYRMVRAVDGSRGHDLNKLRLGPSIDLDKNHELEFRWARSWDAHGGQHASDAYSLELTRKF